MNATRVRKNMNVTRIRATTVCVANRVPEIATYSMRSTSQNDAFLKVRLRRGGKASGELALAGQRPFGTAWGPARTGPPRQFKLGSNSAGQRRPWGLVVRRPAIRVAVVEPRTAALHRPAPAGDNPPAPPFLGALEDMVPVQVSAAAQPQPPISFNCHPRGSFDCRSCFCSCRHGHARSAFDLRPGRPAGDRLRHGALPEVMRGELARRTQREAVPAPVAERALPVMPERLAGVNAATVAAHGARCTLRPSVARHDKGPLLRFEVTRTRVRGPCFWAPVGHRPQFLRTKMGA